MDRCGYFLYLLLTCSHFLHLAARIPFLAGIRIDLLLIVLVGLLKLLDGTRGDGLEQTGCEKWLQRLVITILVITPFAQYPGSVLQQGIPEFLKAVIFFYFTVWYITTDKRLNCFVSVFVACQIFRIAEPLYLHETQGYWGDRASMLGGHEFMNRLAGSLFDGVNSNGLAYVVLTVFCFIPFLAGKSFLWKALLALVVPLALYTLMLTGSRSGFAVLLILCAYTFYKSVKKVSYLVGALVLCVFLSTYLTDVLKDRYTSIYDSSTKNASTSAGRIDGLIDNARIGLLHPFFGSGLGTSLETNYHQSGVALKTHNVFIEAFVELGLFGFLVYLMFLGSIYQNVFQYQEVSAGAGGVAKIRESLALMFLVTLLYNFASYGLSVYAWYLIAGLSVSVRRIDGQVLRSTVVSSEVNLEDPSGGPVAGRGYSYLHTLRVPKL